MDTQPSPRLYRVALPTDDLERDARFYAELLQQPGQRISPGRHYFGSGSVIVALVSPGQDGDATRPRPNFDYSYFATADLAGVYERARRIGGLSEEIGDGRLPMGEIATRPWGERSFYMQDPFGNPLCFVDEASLFTAGLIP